MIRASLVVVSLLLASSPSAPHAAPASALGVVAIGDAPTGPTAELADLARTFRGTVAASTTGVLTSEELRHRMEGRVATASLTELDRAYTGAVAAFQAGDYERASRTLRAVIEDLERLPPSDQVFAQWSRSMMRLARAEQSLGHRAEARDVMERMLRADPAASPDPELYPPSFARQIDEVRAELRTRPRRKLTITAGGAPARVYVDGRFAGDAPVTLSVSPGRYRVAGVSRDVTSPQVTADLSTDDQTVALDFGVAETLRPASGPGLAVPAVAARRATAIVSAGAFLKLDKVYAVSLATDGDVRYLVGSVFDVSRGSLQREGRVRLGGAASTETSLAALATFLQTGEASSLVITRTEPPPAPVKPRPIAISPEQPGARSQSPVLKWSPFATAGLAVALGGFAIYENSAANSKYSDAKGLLNSNGALANEANRGRYNSLLSDGDSARRNAWIAGGGAVAAVGATAILAYISYKRTGEIGPWRF